MFTDKIVKGVAALLLLVVVTAPAVANVWSFDFESLVPGQDSVTGLIYTTDTLNVFGNFDVTAITGTVNGAPMGALLPNPNQPSIYVAPNKNMWDNNLIPGAPFVTHNGGIGFNFQGDQLVLFSGPTGNPLSEGLFSQNAQRTTIGKLSVTQAVASLSLNQHGLTGSWYEPTTSGQGIELEFFPNLVAPGTSFIQGSWFTFDYTAAGGADHQRWYTFDAQGPTGQAGVPITIYQNVGGNFNAPPITGATVVGVGTLAFSDCDTGTLTYSFTDGSGRTGTINLTRLTANVTCVTGTATPTTNPDFGFSGNWFDPATAGQGVVLEVNPVSPVLFFAWYTYAPNGQAAGASGQRWFTGQASYTAGSRSVPVTLYETTGGLFDQVTMPPPSSVAVGTGTITLTNCGSAQLSFNFTGGSSAGKSGTISLVRVGPVPPGCGP